MNDNKKVTTKSIAKALGISHTTVSNAWNNPDKLSAELRGKIIEYAASCGFQGPDRLGRALRTGKSDTIGVIFNDSMSYVFIDNHDLNLMKGIATQCENHDINLVLIPLKNSQNIKIKTINTLVDGYILNATHNNDEVIQQALAKNIPVVTIDFSLPDHSSVSINNQKAMNEICSYLLNKGHRRFGIISFPSQKSAAGMRSLEQPVNGDNSVMLTRVNACRDVFAAHEIALNECWLYETIHNEQHGAQAAKILLTEHPEISALICLSDRFAAGAINYCVENNIAIPQKVAITGFDNIPVNTSGIRLTTISQHAEEKGAIAVKLLLDENNKTHYELDYQFIEGAST
ncbi:LacI family DNA-binding transcriptional regulator [Buttiauxella sp. 3AFRM03]|uniref:LacI family DNA-binding transcriptional regulator n=1 Tax=Buttiauxella sp. 3AFRM03 TaxID=2479367 RepID=UPI000EF75AC8|nr:LacI family DNA-binding transcriptional regulator [Buttiauxella sp. 3AFRM03]AYN28791.1 LacI family DNA-binding transcriptional regulator [Buttiauxella sp. 3AFRM03]